MQKLLKMPIAASVLMVGLLAAPIALYANDEGSGMMSGYSENMMGNGSMMGQGAGGMMNMRRQMSRMANDCDAMMTGIMSNHGAAPNQQWKQNQPSAPSEPHDQNE